MWQQQDDATRADIWGNRYVVGSGWVGAELIETDNVGNAGLPRITIDTNGNAMAVWQQFDGSRINIWANRYIVGSGWSGATLIENDNLGDARNAQIAVDAQGNAMAVWQQFDGSRISIWTNRYVVGSGWGVAVLIETDNIGNAYFPQIAIDANGNALAVWQQPDDGGYNGIWANRYDVVGSGWSSAVLIESNTGSASNPQIAIDANGNALAIWHQAPNPGGGEPVLGVVSVWANRYLLDSGWGSAIQISDNFALLADSQIAVDAQGNALAAVSTSNAMTGTIPPGVTERNMMIWTNRFE